MGLISLSLFFVTYHADLHKVLNAIARNHGKHPPGLAFMLFSGGGALVLLGACVVLPRAAGVVLWPFVAIGREALLCFNFHIIVVFVLYRYVLGHPTVSLTVMGLRDIERFQRVARALSERVALEPEERRSLEAYGAEMRAAGKL